MKNAKLLNEELGEFEYEVKRLAEWYGLPIEFNWNDSVYDEDGQLIDFNSVEIFYNTVGEDLGQIS